MVGLLGFLQRGEDFHAQSPVVAGDARGGRRDPRGLDFLPQSLPPCGLRSQFDFKLVGEFAEPARVLGRTFRMPNSCRKSR